MCKFFEIDGQNILKPIIFSKSSNHFVIEVSYGKSYDSVELHFRNQEFCANFRCVITEKLVGTTFKVITPRYFDL